MTCIVGFTDKKTGITYMGGDSLASNGYTGSVITQKKVFKLNDTDKMILGFSGAVRDLNLLKYAENLIDKRDVDKIDEKYIVTYFIPRVIDLFKNNDRNEMNKNISESESYFLLGYKDKLWKIEFNYAVIGYDKNYACVGCGTDFAMGSLRTTEDMNLSPIERIHLALQSASSFSVGVGAPFYIINTDNDEVIEFKD